MTHREDSPAPVELAPRDEAVLRAVVESHAETGEPVASKTIARRIRDDLSPATIRAVMASLVERGFLYQPHTSAGRIPTDHAYRAYVDRLMGRPTLSSANRRAIESAIARPGRDLAELLSEASRQLSRWSSQVGVVLAPGLSRMVVSRIEFAALGARRAVAVLIGSSGVVRHRVLELDEALTQDELDRVGRYLTDSFSGSTIPEMQARLRALARADRRSYDRLAARSMELGDRALAAGEDPSDVLVEGTSNLVDLPEFSDHDRMKALLRTLEEKRRLVEILGRVIDGEGVRVLIGEHDLSRDLEHCAVVASCYRSGGRPLGTVGVVGPTRMAYPKAVALVDHLANVLTRVLSRGEYDGESA